MRRVNGKWARFSLLLVFLVAAVGGCESGESKSEEVAEPVHGVPAVETVQPEPVEDLVEKYRETTLIDIHNHDAANPNAVRKWTEYGIDRIVLFGDISEPSAQVTDRMAWEHYRKDPDHVYPSFAGFPIYEEEGLEIVKDKLEQGYLNIGEIAAASTNSPVLANVEWKAEHPNDGFFPEIYELAAQYGVPILLHIDPPSGTPIRHLEEAMEANPDTIFVFAHGNAYNAPSNLEALLEKHQNLYVDFFAGFTAFSPASSNKLEDFVPLIEKYSDRFMLSTDSGYGLTVEQAALGLYELIDLLAEETREKVAHGNYEGLIERQRPTETQLARIRELSEQLGEPYDDPLNKLQANERIFKMESRINAP